MGEERERVCARFSNFRGEWNSFRVLWGESKNLFSLEVRRTLESNVMGAKDRERSRFIVLYHGFLRVKCAQALNNKKLPKIN